MLNSWHEISERQLTLFGIVMSINFPCYYLIWTFSARQSYENLPLRMLAFLLCFFLALYKFWPKPLKPLIPYYWYLTVLVSLPIFFTFMTLKNSGSTIWLMNSMSALFFVLLLFDVLSSILIVLSGIAIGFLLFWSTTSTPFDIVAGSITLSGIIATFVAVFVIGYLFIYNNNKIFQERIDAAKLLAGTIAHELRTPLASITAGATGLKSYLPKLFHAYKRAQEEKISNIELIRPVQFNALQQSLTTIEKEATASNLIITMLLTNLSANQISDQEFSQLSINHCVTEALARYPFSEEMQAKIHWQAEQDFLFQGSEVLTIHILFNLLKNAIYYIRAAERGEIFITIDTSQQQNILSFKDTSVGIDAKELPNIFKQFYSNTRHGTGVGLAFCKSVMKSYGGDIICRSEKGVYTEFVLTFPKI